MTDGTKKRRSVRSVLDASHAVEGDGMPVRRSFPNQALADVDPFLLLDHFGPVDIKPGGSGGSTYASLVGMCVWMPSTADTRPSRYQPIARFSLVASACMSTILILHSSPTCPIKLSIVRNGHSSGGKNTRP